MKGSSYYIVNAVTLFRIIAAPVLVVLIILKQPEIFRWILACSFCTDAIDGYLARRYKVTSLLGAKLDSIGDDLTIAAGLAGILAFKPEFFREEMVIFILLLTLFVIQVISAIIKYGKITSFHTYTAKFAAILQGTFLILFFFLHEPIHILFYLAAFVTALDLVEEIILVQMLPKWEANVKGLYWVIKRK
jgi:phosphatidylglycerophosphate synthase